MSNVGYSTLTVIPSAKGFASKLGGEVNGPMGSTGKKGGKLLGAGLVAAAAKFAAPLAAAIGVGKVIATGFAEAADAARINAQLAAGIASTGNAANASVAGLNKYAGALQLSTGQTDDSIAGAQALLLTFTNIKNVGPDKIFDQATLAAANMAARLGGDAAGQAKVLGKALNDPVGGVTALTRAGVQFTDAQKAQIGTMVEAGDTLGAQKIILAELETQFGGSAEAAGKTFPGQIEILKRSFEDFSQMLVGRFGPSLATGIGFLSSGIQAATPVVDAALTGIGEKIRGVFESPAFQAGAAAIGGAFVGIIPQVLQLVSALSPLGLVLQAAGPQIGQLAVALGTLLGAALTTILPPITDLSTAFVGLITPLLGALIPALTSLAGFLTANLGPLTAIAAVVAGAVIGFKAYSIALTVIKAATIAYAAVQTALNLVMSANPIGIIITALGALVAGIIYVATQTTFFQDTWANLTAFLGPVIANIGSFFSTVFTGIGDVIRNVFTFISSFVTTYINTVRSVIVGTLNVVRGTWNAIWSGIGSFLSDIWNKAVTVVRVAILVVQSVIQSVLNTIRGVWNGLWNGLGTFLSNAFNGYVRFVSTGIQNVLGFFSSLPGNIMGFLSGLPNMLITAGRNMIEGFINGIQDVASGIAEAVLAPIRDAVSGVKDFLGINSPSRLFMEIGGFTGEGMAIGLQKSAGLIRKASDALIPTAPPAPTIGVAGGGGIAGALTALLAVPEPQPSVVINGGVQTHDVRAFRGELERSQRRARMAYSSRVVTP